MKLTILSIIFLFQTLTVVAQDVSVTVYNQNLGLIKEKRQVQVEEGAFTFEATDVAGKIDPTSVHLVIKGASLLDQNFEYDLVSQERLMERYLDQKIQVFSEEGELFEGKLLSSAGSQIVLQEDNGKVISIHPRDIRFGELPGGLRTRPTLVWSLVGKKAGKQEAKLSYMTHGMNWHAEYVAVINEKNNELELSSWVSIDNRSGATYKDAKLKLIAGDVNLIQNRRVHKGRAYDSMLAEDAKSAPPSFAEKSFFEYHLYTLQRPATLKDRQTKQISLFTPATVTAEREYTFDSQLDAKKVRVTLLFNNDEKAGLGIPLPAGKIRVYQEDTDESLEFVGEDMIDHTPKDEEVRIFVGNAFDISAEKKTTKKERISKQVREESYEVELRNHKEENVTVVVKDHFWGNWQILEASHSYEKIDASSIEFKIPVQAGEESIITYRVRFQ